MNTDTPEMTIEERVLAALRCEQSDRVPVFIYLNPYVDSWCSDDPSYADVLHASELYADVIYNWSFPSGLFYNAAELQTETHQLPGGITEEVLHTPEGPLRRQIKPNWGGGGEIKRWICEPQDARRLLSIPYIPPRPDLGPVLEARACTDNKWIVQATFDDPICIAGIIDEMAMAVWTIEHRGLLRELLDTAMERITAELTYCLENGVGPIYYFNGPEYALPPLMSPADFEEFVVQYDRKLVELIHSYPGNYVILHSHGKVSRFLESFASIGIDGLNVLEPPPVGDTILADAKKRIGENVCLIGNIQYDDLARGTEEEIERLVEQAIREGAHGGGFILSPCASPYEQPLPEKASRNLIHYLKMARKHGTQ